MNTILVTSLEAIYSFLVIVTLFQISKHYVLCSVSSLKTKQRHKRRHPKFQTSRRETHSNRQVQNKPPLDYYSYSLPEPEISISFGHDPACYTKGTPEFKQTTPSQTGLILNNYIDDFFTPSPSKEMQNITTPTCQNYHNDSPANDEFITVIEPDFDPINCPSQNGSITAMKPNTEFS